MIISEKREYIISAQCKLINMVKVYRNYGKGPACTYGQDNLPTQILK